MRFFFVFVFFSICFVVLASFDVRWVKLGHPLSLVLRLVMEASSVGIKVTADPSYLFLIVYRIMVKGFIDFHLVFPVLSPVNF